MISRESVHELLRVEDKVFVDEETRLGFLRYAGGQPYAVYYVDWSGTIPQSIDELAAYEDRTISLNYFDRERYLQWSNYLYFVVPERNEVSEPQRRLLEENRRYARKFVVTGSDLANVLQPSDLQPSANLGAPGILSRWRTALAACRLEEAVFGDMSMPARLNIIGSDPIEQNIPLVRATVATSQQKRFLRELQLIEFRAFPARKKFEFGTVNLITGGNGVGKTSLLEAIELLYCGKNFRNHLSSPKYEILAIFSDDTSERVGNARSLEELRQRNLGWYGQSETKSTNLYKSFALFNFLDSDAAARFAMSGSNDETNDQLTRLLAGPETAEAWKTIAALCEAVIKEEKGKSSEVESLEKTLEQLIESSKNRPTFLAESDALFHTVKQMTLENGWAGLISNDSKRQLGDTLIGKMAGYRTILEKSRESLAGDDSFDRFVEKGKAFRKKVDSVEESALRLRKVESVLVSVGKRMESEKSLLASAQLAAKIVNADVLAKQDKFDLIIARRNHVRGIVGNFDLGRLDLFHNVERPLERELEDLKALHFGAVRELAEAEDKLTSVKALHSNRQALAQDLRGIARRLFEHGHSGDTCPLCQTRFADEADLAERITAAILDHQGEKTVEDLVKEIEILSKMHEAATAKFEVASDLLRIYRLFDGDAGASTGMVVKEVQERQRELDQLTVEVERLGSELAHQRELGLSRDRFLQIRELLNAGGYEVGLHPERLDDLVAELEEALDCLVVEEKRLKSEKDAELAKCEANFGVRDLQALESQLLAERKELDRMRILYEDLRTVVAELFWPHDQPLSSLHAKVEKTYSLAVSLLDAIHREEIAQKEDTATKAQLDKIRGALANARPDQKRWEEVRDVLTAIVTDQSLQSEMNQQMDEIRARVRQVFEYIHTPREFEQIGTEWDTLVRKGGEKAKLTEVSTGQRAAYALSIFLARNSELKDAPPVILMDDPIANVDDLNSLAFLDFLRHVAVGGSRQIFFATADTKLASLFQKKFEFLGREFQRIQLDRG